VPKFGMFFMCHLFNYTEPANTGWRTKNPELWHWTIYKTLC